MFVRLGEVITLTPTKSLKELTDRVQYYFDQIVQQYKDAGYGQGNGTPDIPYDQIQQQAIESAQQEELQRQQQEKSRMEEEKWKAIQRSRGEASAFQLPSEIKEIRKGVLVIEPKGAPVERRK